MHILHVLALKYVHRSSIGSNRLSILLLLTTIGRLLHFRFVLIPALFGVVPIEVIFPIGLLLDLVDGRVLLASFELSDLIVLRAALDDVNKVVLLQDLVLRISLAAIQPLSVPTLVELRLHYGLVRVLEDPLLGDTTLEYIVVLFSVHGSHSQRGIALHLQCGYFGLRHFGRL